MGRPRGGTNTHHTKEDLQRILPWIYNYKGIYIKYGEYREDL